MQTERGDREPPSRSTIENPKPRNRRLGAPATAEPAPPELTPVVLVYRDGHREQIREYSIANGTIYARGDYWNDGYWSKKIQLTALDLPASSPKASAAQDLGDSLTHSNAFATGD